MTAAVVPLAAPLRRNGLWLFLAASILLHGLGLGLAARAKPIPLPLRRPPSQLVVVEVEAPRPHPPEPPPRTEVHLRPKAAAVAPRTPTRPEAPPPNDTPPPAPGPAPPVVVGLTLESTTTASTVAVPVGNTLGGKPTGAAVAPSTVRPGYAPLYLVDTPPEPLEVETGEDVYPAQARKLGVEGHVQLLITVDATGHVSAARVVSGPGHGLDEAAKGAILRARFKPATKAGKPVATDVTYFYTFVLDR